MFTLMLLFGGLAFSVYYGLHINTIKEQNKHTEEAEGRLAKEFADLAKSANMTIPKCNLPK